MEAQVRALVVSDLHSNAAALRAVFSRVRRKRYDEIVCLGDFVGYGAEPNQVLDAMRTARGRKLYIRGNHDRVAAGLDDAAAFNAPAREAAFWNRDHLSGPNRRFIEKLPVGPLAHDGVMLCHGSPADEDEYVFTIPHAAQIFEMFDAPIILYGHTHLPVIFSIDRNGEVTGTLVRGETTWRLEPDRRYLINPGSVGQPRDRDPDASFAIVDTIRRTASFFRVEYAIEKTREAILRAGLPRILADRLRVGT
ncbi:MAG TPA: metallophosphoesterase family protein [Thermoanaerobaculia bacterium]|nr:metallophosphoesterase family protein [Thermoanaerobaculia bacterium]